MKARIILVLLLFGMVFDVQARNFALPRVSKGDILSALWFNQILSRIEKAQTVTTKDDLVGVWSCKSYSTASSGLVENAGWELDDDGLCYVLESELTFSGGNGADYIISASAPNPFSVRGTNFSHTTYGIIGDTLAFRMNLGMGGNDMTMAYTVKKRGDSEIELVYPMGASSQFATLFCEKQNLPPAEVSELLATVSGASVSLSWTDESDDETGFKIYRKVLADDDFTEIGTPTSASYTDVDLSAGIYFYRVTSYNDDGESYSSNVQKVTIE